MIVVAVNVYERFPVWSSLALILWLLLHKFVNFQFRGRRLVQHLAIVSAVFLAASASLARLFRDVPASCCNAPTISNPVLVGLSVWFQAGFSKLPIVTNTSSSSRSTTTVASRKSLPNSISSFPFQIATISSAICFAASIFIPSNIDVISI